jgi:hypothetical protein
MLALLLLSINFLLALSVVDTNRFIINNINFSLNLEGTIRISDFNYQTLDFCVNQITYPDSICLQYRATELDLQLSLKQKPGLGANAWLVNAVATFNTDVLVQNLFLRLDFENANMHTFKGVQAIASHDNSLNRNITPYSNKAIAYNSGANSFWIVASNYADCSGVEGLTNDRVVLYDNTLHFARRYRPATNSTDIPMDAMLCADSSTRNWSFLIFCEEPELLDISRWPEGKKAALSITNDADAESVNRLSAFYLGSSNPSSPKYLTQGSFANNIPISNTVFGFNQPALQGIWNTILEHGSTIGYHTYAATTDIPGTNAQALLSDLLPFNIRLWIDHNLPQNAEDLAWNGLDETSENYVGDVLNESGIDYAWLADTPVTNPFDAYDDPWRLPHLLYEARSLTKPLWFFGRTRTEVWEYTNGNYLIDMKNVVTPDNLDKLIANKGLHISYTHFGAGWDGVVPFYCVTDSGDYEIRPEVEDFLQMLAFYRDYRGLWIDTVENIFDRMLAIEQVRVTAISPSYKQITLHNDSGYELADFSFTYRDKSYCINAFPAHSDKLVEILPQDEENACPPVDRYHLSYQNGCLYVENKDSNLQVPADIFIYNLKGQLVKQQRLSSTISSTFIPFNGYASGIYVAKISAPNRMPSVQKFSVIK